MAQSLDEIVWAVDPRHDTLPSVVEYLSHQADDLLEETNIRLKLNRPKDVPNHVVSARLRHQLFLAVSEALNNAVKHSQATQMEIDISLVKSRFQIIVSDNGVGFDPQDQKEKGHGMSNMQARLKNIEGNFEITSQPGRGARVLISVEIKSPRELQKNGVASTLSQK
jgi:signal transduction histidine kinase